MGIDPGSMATGYGMVDSGSGGRLRRVCHGAITPASGLALQERLLAISAELRLLIEEHAPEVVSLESVFFARNARSAIVLGQARGAALLTVAGFSLPVYEYAPSSVKQAVTGCGKATKEQVSKMVGLLLGERGLEGRHDSTDALALAICHINSGGPIGHGQKAKGSSARAGRSL